MTDQSPTSRQMTLPGLSVSTSSPASADGTAPCSLPLGQSDAPSGPAAAPVRRSAKPANAKAASDARARTLCGALDELATAYAQTAATHGLPTAATYGRKPGASSHEVGRLSSLESRLQALTDLNGSPEYALRWKSSPMLLGAPIIRLRASARRISDSAFSGWPTPMAGSPGTHAYNPAGNTDSSRKTVELCGWPTPDAQAFNANSDIEKTNARIERLKAKGINGNGAGYTLGSAVQLAGWPTPTKGNADGSQIARDASATGRRPDGSKATVSLNQVAQLTGWPTARATDGEKNVRSPEGSLREIDRKGGPQDLCQAANLTGWSTPSTRDWKDTPGMATTAVNPDGSTRKRVDQLPRQALLASGPTSTLSTAPTGKRAASLNPRFSGWLMGYPTAWCEAALKVPKASRSRKAPATASDGSVDTGTPSTRTRRRGSSVPGGK